jgi:hypothetical protein
MAGPPEQAAEAAAAMFGQDPEILRQQLGGAAAVGHDLHRADRPDDRVVALSGEHRAGAAVADAGVEEGEALGGQLLREDAERPAYGPGELVQRDDSGRSFRPGVRLGRAEGAHLGAGACGYGIGITTGR